MKYALPAAAAVVLLVGGRWLEDRWHSEFRSVPVRLETIGHKLEGWDGRDLQLDGKQASWAQLGDGTNPAESSWRWSVLLKAYNGPAPFGEFYRDDVSYLGVGVGFTL